MESYSVLTKFWSKEVQFYEMTAKSSSRVEMICYRFFSSFDPKPQIFNNINVWWVWQPHNSWNIILKLVVPGLYVTLKPVSFVAKILSINRPQIVFQDWNIFLCIYITIDKATCYNFVICNATPHHTRYPSLTSWHMHWESL